ncbi:MAG: hypothetical protein WA941_13625 [Nitrososphaeraceae archaeon]
MKLSRNKITNVLSVTKVLVSVYEIMTNIIKIETDPIMLLLIVNYYASRVMQR